MRKLRQRLISGALTFVMIYGMLPEIVSKAAVTQQLGLGEVSMEWNREIYNGVSLNHAISENTEGLQKSYTITYDPKTTEIKPLLSYGPYVMGGDIMSDMVRDEEASGSKVVFAINGDAYDTSNGVSSGLMIRDGILISTSSSSEALGFKADGSAVYGSTDIDVKATPNGGSPITVTHVNKERKLDTYGVYLLTEQFAKTTKSTQPGVEVVLNVTTPSYKGLVIGEEITATVASVNQVEANPDKNDTAIGAGQIAICTNSESSSYNALNSMQAGQSVTIETKNSSPDVDWSQVSQAIGVFHTLMKNGVETPGVRNNSEIHPRTAVGIKADGSIVLFQCDGRQAGYAIGLTFAEMMDYLQSQGCQTIYNLDGGGSSTITATLPGDNTSTILNRPSDGSERANCNALLFMATSVPDSSRSLLHVYPDIKEGYGNKVMVLENGKLNFNVGATDNNYHYMNLSGTQLKYTAEGDIGTVSSNGVLTTAAGTHDGKIIVSTQDDSAKGEIEVQVVEAITKLSADRSILSVAPGKTTQLSFTAEHNGSPVVLTSEALNFHLSDDNLGSISADGTFTASNTQGTGELTISYKDYTLTIPVEIGKLPVPLNDFETEFDDMGWKWRYFNGADGGLGNRGGDAKMSINRDERFVKSGDASLRVDYDFATKPLTGTVTCECGPKDTLILEGQPKAIGCWIYGDGNGEWIRIQLSPAAYAGDVYVNWVGWKYIENAIPSTATFPYQLVWGVRVLGTASVANGKKGTIYVDGLRAVYDFKNDDVLAPELIPGTEATPTNGSTNVVNEPDISITVRDPQVAGQPYTGINTDRTKLWINGKVMSLSAIQQEVQPDGSVKITFHPGALTVLRPGLNKVKYRVEDNAGNKFFHEWSFTVAGYAVNLIETYPSEEKAAAGSTFHYIINATDYNKFEDFQLELGFNPNYVTLLNARYDSRLMASVNDVDSGTGTVKYTLSGMSALSKDTNNPMVDLEFKVGDQAGGQTGIKVNKAIVRQTGEISGTDLVLDGYDREVALKYTLSWTGSTVGGKTTLKLVDSSGNPVPSLGFHVTQNSEAVTFSDVTGTDGTLTTDFFGKYPVGTEFLVWVVDETGALSNKQKITVFDSLGSADPAKVTITTGENPSVSVGVSWETSLSVSAGNLLIGKSADLSGSDTYTISASCKIITTSMNGYQRNYQSWGVRATNLSPDTTYYYKVGYEGHYSEVKSFTTAPASGDLTLAFYGDIQGSYTKFPDAIQALKALYPDIDLNLQAGDVSDDAQSYSDWSNAYSGFGSYLENSIWAPTIGNHDSSNDAQAFTSYFYGPNNGTYNTSRNYWFTIGDIIFYNLDTESYSYDPGFAGEIAHMKEVFASSDKSYKVVLMHRSAYPMNYDEADVRALHTAFEEAGATLVLSGHDHIYNRTEMYAGQKNPAVGISYVVGGCSSGSKYYDGDSNGRTWQNVVYDDNNPVFSVLKLREGVLTLEAYALVGGETKLIDQFTVLNRSGSGMLGTAKTIVESAENLNVIAQAKATDAHQIEQYMADSIKALPNFSLTGAAVSVEVSDFVPAVAGNKEHSTGTNGSFKYSVKLTIGSESVTIDNQAGVITSTAYQPVTGLTLDRDSTSVYSIGSSVTLIATIQPENASNKSIAWGSGDEKVATVKYGVVTAMGEGSTIITATTVDGGFAAECKVDVYKQAVSVKGITLSKDSVSVYSIGSSVTLIATIQPENASDKSVNWSSDNDKVATVKDGVVTAEGEGTATITASTIDGGFTAKCSVNVSTQHNHSSGSNGGTTTAPPVESSSSGNTTTTSGTLNASTDSSGKASGSISSSTATALIEGAKAAESSGKEAVVEIKLKTDKSAKATEISVPKISFDSLASGTNAELRVNTGLGIISFDASAVDAINSAASGDIKISVAKADTSGMSDEVRNQIGNRTVYDFTVTSGGKTISSFGNGNASISLPYTPSSGEDLNAIVVYYLSDSGKLETVRGVYNSKTGTVDFVTDHFSKYVIGYNKVVLGDVAGTDWYYNAVTFIAARKITTGTSVSTFSPNGTLTRGQFIVMLMRAYGIEADVNPTNNFSDAGNAYYTNYLAAAKRLGISTGIGSNLFAPESEISRQDMFTLLYRALNVIGELPVAATTKTTSDFSDAGKISSYAKDAMDSLVKGGIISGSDNNLNPLGTSTRAEMAQVLYKLLSL